MYACGNHRIPKSRCVSSLLLTQHYVLKLIYTIVCQKGFLMFQVLTSVLSNVIGRYEYWADDCFKCFTQLTCYFCVHRTTDLSLSAARAVSFHPSTSLPTRATSVTSTVKTLRTTFYSTVPTALTMATKRLWKHTSSFSICPTTTCGRVLVVWCQDLVGLCWRMDC